MSKKVLNISIAFVLGLLVALVIGKTNAEKQTASVIDSLPEKPVVLSTFTIIADMVSVVGGDKIESISLTKPGAEIHGYQPTPDDLVQASKASMIIQNGMNLEIWTKKLQASLPDVPLYTVSQGVTVVDISEDAYAGKPNPHAWMSPAQGLIYVENIKNILSEAMPEHSEYFAQNAKNYSEEIMAVDNKLRTALDILPENNRFLVTCEGAFSYLTKDYDLQEIYLWAINSDAQGSPQQVTKVINAVKKNNIPAVFCESTVEPKIQQEVVSATGAKLGGVLYVDSLSGPTGPASSYLKLLEYTADTIISGLVI